MKTTPVPARRALHAGVLLCAAALAPHGGPPAQEAGPTPAQELKDIEQRLEEEKSGWLAAYRAAGSDAERAELRAGFPREFEAELTALAERAKTTDVAARAWLHVYRLGLMTDERASVQCAVERLVADHVESGETAALTLELVYGTPSWTVPLAEDALRRILAGSKDESVQAGALAQLALLVGQDEALGDEGLEEARALLDRVRAAFGERDFIGMSGNEFADGAAYELENLRVGMSVPDFELADQDGTRFRLSDYRGRVVLLDFWGFV